MESFRSTYRDRCAELGVEPNQGVLATLAPSPLLQRHAQPGREEDGAPGRAGQPAYHPTELLLSSQPLGFKGIKALCAALQPDVVFTRLVLADAFLGDEGETGSFAALSLSLSLCWLVALLQRCSYSCPLLIVGIA
jgi:hypothetical protein